MRVAYLAAGAAGMYCGSCMHDNRAVAALRARGRDVVLLPLYTPLRLDEPPASGGPLFYGGINVYLQQISGLFRRTPRLIDRVLDHPGLLRFAGRRAAKTRPERLGALTVSMLRGADGRQAKELRRLVAALRELRTDLVHLPNLMFAGVAGPLKAALNVPVVCSLTGEDIFLDQLADPWRAQAIDLIRSAASRIDGFVALTRYYGAHAAGHFGLPAARVHHAGLGIRAQDFAPRVAEQPRGGPFTIGYLARLCRDKGVHVSCEAFARLRAAGRDCRLRLAGYLPPAERAFVEVELAKLGHAGLADRVELVGELDRDGKLAFLQSLDVLSVPTVYPEAKGFFVLEALAAGVPVVQPRHGSFPELIEATGGGLLCNPHDPADLAAALAQLMDDPALRRQLATAGRRAAQESFTDDAMAERLWGIYERVVSSCG
jgi:glycosyltransferase involved in cell wall biosynthesis